MWDKVARFNSQSFTQKRFFAFVIGSCNNNSTRSADGFLFYSYKTFFTTERMFFVRLALTDEMFVCVWRKLSFPSVQKLTVLKLKIASFLKTEWCVVWKSSCLQFRSYSLGTKGKLYEWTFSSVSLNTPPFIHYLNYSIWLFHTVS